MQGAASRRRSRRLVRDAGTFQGSALKAFILMAEMIHLEVDDASTSANFAGCRLNRLLHNDPVDTGSDQFNVAMRLHRARVVGTNRRILLYPMNQVFNLLGAYSIGYAISVSGYLLNCYFHELIRGSLINSLQLSHHVLAIRNPEQSLDFYLRVIGMTLLATRTCLDKTHYF